MLLDSLTGGRASVQAREKTHTSDKTLHARLDVLVDCVRGQRPVLVAHALRKAREIAQPSSIERDKEVALGKRRDIRPGFNPIGRERLGATQGLFDQKVVGGKKHHVGASLIHG